MDVKSVSLLIILVILEILSVSSLKYWSVEKNNIFLYLGILGYLSVGILFAYILYTHSNMTVINALWQVLNIILVSTVGILIYKEKLTNLQYIGIIFAIIATIIFSISEV